MTKLFYIFLTIAVFFLSTFSCKFSPKDVEISLQGKDTLKRDEVIKLTNLPPDNVGFILYDMDTKKIIESYNKNRTFIPASTTKVPTAVAALNILGPKYRFKTMLCTTGKSSNGRLKGDLYLKGSGDPLLTVADLMIMAQKLEKEGIKKVSGNFYYDESDYISTEIIDKGMEKDESYNSGVSALSLEYNSIFARWKKERKSKTADIFLVPSLPINRAGTSSKDLKENVKFDFRKDKNLEAWFLSPDAKRNGRERLPVKQAALYTGYMFKKICSLKGIEIPDPRAGILPESHELVYAHKGRALEDIVDLTLTYSINIMSELMLMRAARDHARKAMSLRDSSEVIARYLQSLMPDINWEGFTMVNGSGLTSSNRISPEQMLAFLLYADEQDYKGKKFMTYLPVSGWEWSLLSRLNRPDTAFHVWAKTGSINYAIALSGYLYTRKHRRMAFAIFMNDIEKRKAFEADPDRRGKKSMRQVYGFINQNKAVMDGMVRKWVNEL